MALVPSVLLRARAMRGEDAPDPPVLDAEDAPDPPVLDAEDARAVVQPAVAGGARMASPAAPEPGVDQASQLTLFQ
jgi:hypothetical protein